MELITTHVPEHDLARIEKALALGIYPNRSELIRVAVRDLLREELGPSWVEVITKKSREDRT